MELCITIIFSIIGGIIGGVLAYLFKSDRSEQKVTKYVYDRESTRRTEAQEIKDAIEWWYAWNEAREDDMR